MKIDETHDLIVEPGPYPPGEGPLDYAECAHRCRSFAEPCMSTWPVDGWDCIAEPVQPPWWDSAPSEGHEVDPCTGCGADLGYVEAEYEGQYGLRLVAVWIDGWTHPALPGVVACEDCTMVNWEPA